MLTWLKPKFLYLAIIAFALNLCFAFQIANLSSIFKFLGTESSNLPLLWLVPPITGLIVQPLIGQISDETVSRFGKRRPYILGWGLLGAISFALIPFTNSIAYVLMLMWVIDCSLNGSSECLRALTGDLTFKDKRQSKAFSLQAFFSGIGGTIGAALPYFIDKYSIYFHSKEKLAQSQLPYSLKTSLYIISGLLFLVLSTCVFKVDEKSNYRPTLFTKNKKNSLWKRTVTIFRDLYFRFLKIPPIAKRICLVHSFTWVGIYIFWLYFSVTLTQNFYHTSNPGEHTALLHRASLNASYYFSTYQYVSVFYAIIIYFISNASRDVYIHAISILIGGVSIAAIGLFKNPIFLWFEFVGIGILWGSMIILPYSIIIRVLPRGRMGIYLGIFNICITAPQLICGLLLKPVYIYIFQKQAGYLLIFAGCVIATSAVCWLKIQIRSNEIQGLQQKDFVFENVT